MLDPHGHLPFQLESFPDGSFSVRWQDLTLLQFQSSGIDALIGADIPPSIALADVLRWGAPFALARSGLFLLHAACVAHEHRAIAFVAPGGTGKSTLGHTLKKTGWLRISDDALLCGPGGQVDGGVEVVLRDWCHKHAAEAKRGGQVNFAALTEALSGISSISARQADLAAIVFLELPRTHNGRFSSRRLSSIAGFHQLVQHGFASSPTRAIWQDEARVYGALANTVPLWSVRAPEGLEAMQGAVSEWLPMMMGGPMPLQQPVPATLSADRRGSAPGT
jgi:hypothetical protein